MRRLFSIVAVFVFLSPPLWSQVDTSKLKVRAILVDNDLNQKPVPRLSVALVRTDQEGTQPVQPKQASTVSSSFNFLQVSTACQHLNRQNSRGRNILGRSKLGLRLRSLLSS